MLRGRGYCCNVAARVPAPVCDSQNNGCITIMAMFQLFARPQSNNVDHQMHSLYCLL